MRRQLLGFTAIALFLTSMGTAHALLPNETRRVLPLVRQVAPDLDKMWRGNFKSSGRYRSPHKIDLYFPDAGPGGNFNTACGINTSKARRNAFYCAADHNIYMDAYFMNQIIGRYAKGNDLGDGAVATILAHEWGHHIQFVQKWPWPKFPAVELQADCFAGIYDAHALTQSKIMDRSDVLEGARVLSSFGDSGKGRGTHGTPKQRLHWFTVGFRTTRVAACNDAYKIPGQHVHVRIFTAKPQHVSSRTRPPTERAR